MSVSARPPTPALELQMCATTSSCSHGIMYIILINCPVSFELMEKLVLETGLPPTIPDPSMLVLKGPPLRHLVREWTVPLLTL